MARTRKMLLGIGVLSLASPGVALAADPLDCMGQSYDVDELGQIEVLSADFSLTDESSATEALTAIAVSAADDCSLTNDWTEDQLYFATIYEMSRLSEAAFRGSGRLGANQLLLLDEALAKRDRPELWSLMERAVLAGFNGEDAEFSAQEEFTMGAFVISAGLGEDAAEAVGELMGIMALGRYSRREFEALGQE